MRTSSHSGRAWADLIEWLTANGFADEADAIRVFWPTLRDDVMAGGSLDETLRQVAWYSTLLGRRERGIEERRHEQP